MDMEYYIGSILLFAFSWAPRDCAQCNGAVIPIDQNQALFSLIGYNFGGSASKKTFGLPDLRGRVVVGVGKAKTIDRKLADTFGADTVTLTELTLPEHMHLLGEAKPGQTVAVISAATVKASEAQANKINPKDCYWAKSYSGTTTTPSYASTADVTMAADAVEVSNSIYFNVSNLSISKTGSSKAFENNPPSLTLFYAICTQGMYPQRP
jgi:microcystin-dependent protein